MTVLADRHTDTALRTWTRPCRLDRRAAVGDVGSRGQAAGMSRAITGGRRGEPTSTSLLKQVFCLVDGRYLDDETQALQVYDVRMVDGFVVELATI